MMREHGRGILFTFKFLEEVTMGSFQFTKNKSLLEYDMNN